MFKRNVLLILSIVASIIIIVNYNVVGGGLINDSFYNNDVDTTDRTISYSRENVSLAKIPQSPLTDHTLFNTISMLRYLNPNLLAKEYSTALRGKASWFTCHLCSTAVAMIRYYPSVPTVRSIFTTICSVGYEEQRVCEGLARLFGEELVYILVNSELANAEICGLIIGSNCMPTMSEYPFGKKWQLPIIPIPQEVTHRLQVAEPRNQLDLAAKEKNISTILHLSDIHLDVYYQVNSPAACSEPFCCRATSTASKRSYPAGTWGSLDDCDSVYRTVESLLGTITRDHSDHYRYVLLTGDYMPHDIWNTTREEIISTTRTFNGLLKKHVPKDKIIIPVVGNHEATPVDQFCPSSLSPAFSTDWLYKELLDQWKEWIPAEYHQTFLNYGYYSRVVDKARFIVLNMNYCARLNFWNVLKYNDMADMLQWFQYELHNATVAGQYVYVVGHIAPDETECTTHWVLTYQQIIEVFKNVIRGQFFGHTHMDEIRIYYRNQPDKPNEPIGMAYLAPSVTTFLGVNPSFRFYTTDPDSGEIVDHVTYYMNITEANNGEKQFNPFESYQPVWRFEYSARDSYNLTSLSAQEWDEFTKRAMLNPRFLKEYVKHYGRYDDETIDNKSIPSMLTILERIFVK